MRCPMQTNEGAGALLAYCSGKLDADGSALLKRHLEECGECRKVADAQKAVWSALDAWEAMPVSADFDRNLYARIEREASSAWWTRIFGPRRFAFRPAVPLAAACAAVLAAILIKPVPPPDISSQARVESVEIEQVEQALEDLEMLKQLSAVTRGDPARNL